MQKDKLIEVRHLSKTFQQKQGIFGAKEKLLPAVDDVSLTIYRGETLGVVGESGCGKSTLGKMILGLLPAESGEIYYHGEPIHGKTERQLLALRQKMQIVFQDPYGALNPYMTIKELVAEPLIIHNLVPKDKLEETVREILTKVGLGQYDSSRYPHQFSGGQRQRICIARALAVSPEFIFCDEPVSALDVSIQSQIINLLMDLQKEFQLTYLFISHSFAVIRNIADRVAVMYLGRIVELAETDDFFAAPLHPYSRVLLDAVLIPDPQFKRKNITNFGEITPLEQRLGGCAFHTRCKHSQEICRKEQPELKEITANHFCACHFAQQFKEESQ